MIRRKITDQQRATVARAALAAHLDPDGFLEALADQFTLVRSKGRTDGLWRAAFVVVAVTLVGGLDLVDVGPILGVIVIAAVLDLPFTRALIWWVDRNAP